MKILGLTASLVLIFVTAGFAQQKCKEYTLPASVMAFCPPADWIGNQDKGEKHLTFNKKVPETQFPATIMIKEEKLDGPVEMYFYGMVKEFFRPDEMTGKSIIDISDLQTTSGLKGSKFLSLMETNSIHLRQIWYVFDTPKGIKLTFIVIAPADDPKGEAAAVNAIKTVRLK